jgi:hypothetical protein
MRSRFVLALLIIAALAYACGPRSRAGEPSRQDVVSGPPVACSLNVRVGTGVTFAFHITNNAPKRLEINFPSGQTHDIVVLDSVGREVWRWSEGKMFTQSLQNKVLQSNETLTYQASWKPDAQRGKYVAVAKLMSANHPLEQRVEFDLP